MRYALALLTHGEAPALHAALDSFAEMVTPAPAARVSVIDGNGSRLPPVEQLGRWEVTILPTAHGFCRSTFNLWQVAAAAAVDYVFWLENDFLFDRPVDLADIAAVLDGHSDLAQMALTRNPVNEHEHAAGGLVESRPGEYERHWSDGVQFGLPLAWLKHRSYFTTNPSLMRRSFMADNPWPDYYEQCEGRFGLDLVEHGYAFGIWGAGEPWVQHVGARTGHGY